MAGRALKLVENLFLMDKFLKGLVEEQPLGGVVACVLIVSLVVYLVCPGGPKPPVVPNFDESDGPVPEEGPETAEAVTLYWQEKESYDLLMAKSTGFLGDYPWLGGTMFLGLGLLSLLYISYPSIPVLKRMPPLKRR
jgi:hypothetical protein